MPNRIELSESLKGTSRRPIDAGWSKPKKIAVASVAGTLAAAGLAWGIFSFIDGRPPRMPTTPEQAVLALASDNFNKLDGERQNAIRSQAVRLLTEAPREQQQELRETIELTEEGRQQLREAFMEDMVRKFARGEGNPWEAMMGQMRGPRPGGERPEGERREGRPEGERQPGEGRPGGGGGEGGEGDRPSREERQQQMRSRIQERMASGNSQTMALIGEFFSSMRAQREQNGGGGNGGGRRGGGGGG